MESDADFNKSKFEAENDILESLAATLKSVTLHMEQNCKNEKYEWVNRRIVPCRVRKTV